MINTSKHGTLEYLHTLGAHVMYYLKITGHWSHIYINYLLVIEYTYLNLDVEATICQSLKYINTRIHMTPCVKYVIKMKLEMNSTIYLFVQCFRKAASSRTRWLYMPRER